MPTSGTDRRPFQSRPKVPIQKLSPSRSIKNCAILARFLDRAALIHAPVFYGLQAALFNARYRAIKASFQLLYLFFAVIVADFAEQIRAGAADIGVPFGHRADDNRVRDRVCRDDFPVFPAKRRENAEAGVYLNENPVARLVDAREVNALTNCAPSEQDPQDRPSPSGPFR